MRSNIVKYKNSWTEMQNQSEILEKVLRSCGRKQKEKQRNPSVVFRNKILKEYNVSIKTRDLENIWSVQKLL